MTQILIFFGLAACFLLALTRWQWGIWLCVAVGFLQDPLRKLVPGEPVYMIGLCAGVFAVVIVSLALSRYRFSVKKVPGWRPGVSNALIALVCVIVVQLLVGYINFKSPFIVALGVLVYFTPILAILVGFYFACRVGEQGLVSFMVFYSLCSILFTSGIFLEYLGFEWRVLGEVGSGLIIYDVGTKLKSYSGFFRASEIAAWHIVMSACFLLILATRTRFTGLRMLCVLGIVFLIAAGILTGRRKLIVSVVIFLSCYWFMITVYYQRSLRVAVVVILLGATAFWFTAQRIYEVDNSDGVYDLYVERASGVFGDITERGRVLGLGAVVSAVKKYGLVGLGAGAASQGARFGGDLNIGYQYEAEGGLGRIVVELGLIGLLVLIWLIVAFSSYLRRVMQYVSTRGGSFGYICYGLVGILLANLAHFTVASQVFSDPNILILLGLFTGIVVSSPVQVRPRQLAEELAT